MEGNKSFSMETLLKLDDSFNMASLLGKSIQATAYRLQHPDAPDGVPVDYKPTTGKVVMDNGSPVFPSDEYETKVSNQMAQLAALFSPEVKEFLRPSALLAMLMTGAEQLGLDSSVLETEYCSSAYAMKASVAWVVAKRVFSIRHPEETIKLISVVDSVIKNPGAFHFVPFDETDKKFIIESLSSVRVEDLEADAPLDAVLGSISQLVSSGKIFLPSAEAFRRQNDFALAAADRKLPVGGGANITAKITAPDGKSPLKLSMFEMHIEAAVGQLFQENGLKPITVTPEQIFRTFAGLSSGATVSDKQREETIKAMDKLIITPATLDFTEQIEKHTRMKKRAGFDYNDTQRRGTLITGVHDRKSTKTYNGIVIKDTFTIHELPMFYAYSYAMGQLYTVQAKFLSGETQPDPDAAKKAKPIKTDLGKRHSTIDDTVLFRVLLEYIEYQRTEKEKRDRKYAREKKPVPATFEFYLPFDTVAEKAMIEKPAPRDMRNIREKTYNFMTEQAKMGNIKKCIYYKKGRMLYGIKVTI